jgi:hypothetical protein
MHPLRSLPVVAACSTLAIAQITPGNLVVVEVGTGGTALSAAAAPVGLRELTRTGSLVQTIALPTVATLPQRPVTLAGSGTGEGLLTQSREGQHLVLAGYGAPPGTPAVASTASAVVPRVIAVVGLDGQIDTTTALANAHSGGSIASAWSWSGYEFYTAGGGVVAPGLHRGVTVVSARGATASTPATTNLDEARGLVAFGVDHVTQLYATSGAPGFAGVSAIGSGLPGPTPQTATLLAGFAPPIGNPSQYAFWFADAVTIYVADERSAAAGGGIQRWNRVGATWTLAYTLSPGEGCRGLSGIVDENGTHLFATTATPSGNRLVAADDTGPSAVFTTLAVAAANTAFRGVQFVRTPFAIRYDGTNCPASNGAPQISTAGGWPAIGSTGFGFLLDSAPPLSLYVTALAVGTPLFPVGTPLPGAPACAELFVQPDLVLAGVTDPSGIAFTAVPIVPAHTGLWGLVLAAQHLVWDPLYHAGLVLPFGTSMGAEVVIGN